MIESEGGWLAMIKGILATVTRLLRDIGSFFVPSFRYSSDLRSSKSYTRRVRLGQVSSQVSDLSTRTDDLIWIVATLSDQLSSVSRRLEDLVDEILGDD